MLQERLGSHEFCDSVNYLHGQSYKNHSQKERFEEFHYTHSNPLIEPLSTHVIMSSRENPPEPQDQDVPFSEEVVGLDKLEVFSGDELKGNFFLVHCVCESDEFASRNPLGYTTSIKIAEKCLRAPYSWRVQMFRVPDDVMLGYLIRRFENNSCWAGAWSSRRSISMNCE